MKNLMYVMKWKDACEAYEYNVLPYVRNEYEQDGLPDLPARREAWNNWTDSLCKNGDISDWQYENWGHPPSCGD